MRAPPTATKARSNDDSTVKSYVTLGDGNQQDETVTWSRVRYTGYCYWSSIANRPRTKDKRRPSVDRGLSSTGAELDRPVLARTI